MDYSSNFEFDKEFKENFNSDNIPEMNIDTYINSKKFDYCEESELIRKATPMVNVRFSQLSEMTGMLGKFKHSMDNINELGRNDSIMKNKLIKCYFSQEISKPTINYITESRTIKNYLTMYSVGGFRYFASINLPILAVFPLEDGFICKCVYDPKLIKVDLKNPKYDVTYAYITLSKHPLNDLHPLGKLTESGDVIDMINTTYDLLFVSEELPICILFDESSHELIFAILRKNGTDEDDELDQKLDFNAFFKKERNALISHISNKSEILINIVKTDIIETGVKPSSFEIVNSFDENVFFIAMHFSLLCETRFYLCRIDSASNAFNVEFTRKVDNIVKISTIEFLSQNELFIPKICKKQNTKRTQNYDAEIIKHKVKENLNKEIILLDSNGSLHFYKGDFLLISFLPGSEVHKEIISKGQYLDDMIEDISNPKSSRITLHLTKGQAFRFDLQFKGKLRNFILQSCLEIMRVVLPINLFSKFYGHLLYILFSNESFTKRDRPCVWKIFTELFFTLLDRNFDLQMPKSSIGIQRETSAFVKMINSKSGRQMLNNSSLNLFAGKSSSGLQQKYTDKLQKENFDKSILELERLRNIFSKDEILLFSACSEDIFKVFHLMYEDIKLNIFNIKFLKDGDFISFLFLLCLKKGPRKFAYSEYYIREHPYLLKLYQDEYNKYRAEYKNCLSLAKEDMEQNNTNSNYVIPSILSEPLNKVPSIYSWIESKLHPNQYKYESNYFCFFETTRKVCRLFEIFNDDNPVSTCKIHPLLKESKTDDDMDVEFEIDLCRYPLLCNSNFQAESVSMLNSDEYYMKNRSMNLFEKIVFCLKEEYMGRDSIKRLPLGISLPIQEVLSHEYFKSIYVNSTEEEKRIIEEWPKEIFRLIEREDLYSNLQEMKKNMDIMEEITPEFQFSRISTLNMNNTLLKRKSTIKLGRTESNVFANIKKSIVPHKNINKNYIKKNQNNPEEQEAQEYMDLIEKEFKSLSLKNKTISESHYINYRFSSDLRYMEVCLMLDSSTPFKLRIDRIQGIDQMTVEQLDTAKSLMHEKRITRQFAKCVGRGALKLGTMHTVPTEKLKIPDICKTGLLPPDNKKIECKDENQNSHGWADFHNGVATGLQLATEFDPYSNHIKNWILFHRPPQAKNDFGGFIMSMGFHGYLKCYQKIDIYQYMKTKHEAYTVGLLLGGAASLIGTADEAFSKALCINISYLHPRNLDIEISTSIQCAALVGEGLLYKGSNYRQVTEMLLSQLGKRPINNKNSDRESYSLSAGIALGIVNLGCGSELPGMSDLKIDERLIRFIEGGKNMEELPSMKGIHEEEACSSFKEGENVNLYVTLPGAVYALTLIHLKTNNKQIADRIELPKTFHALEFSRPSDVILKVLCKNLIMWDSISSSKDWINSQIPEIIRNIYYEKEIEKIELSYQTRISIDEIDFANISMLYTYFLAGSLLSIGFKYAGSGNREVFEFLNSSIEKIINMKVTNSSFFQPNIAHKYTNSNKNNIDKRTYETCLCISAFAISMIMAGTGDVECFVTLRRIRKLLEYDMNYGFTMAIHMAIGFLFLGSGKYTFSTSNLSIASLLIALYPKFPESPQDNRYHLQALRHFYVLAIENRLLQSVDIETGELVSVPLEIEYIKSSGKSNPLQPTEIRLVNTPIMLEDMHKITKIHLRDKKYNEVIIERNNYMIQGEKGSVSVFTKASSLVEKPEFTNKSVSKTSVLNPFDINNEHSNQIGWIPKIIYVKKRLPVEENREKALFGKLSMAFREEEFCYSLAPFEFSRALATILNSLKKDKEELECEGEGEGDEEGDNETSSLADATKLNEVSRIFSTITENPVIRKFLQIMCKYSNVVYSELEPSIIKGELKRETAHSKLLSDVIECEDYFELMELTEYLTEELDAGLRKERMFNKSFYLGILNECFLHNKIEVLPIYLRLFNSSFNYKNFNHLADLIKEGKLISLFYKGLYENKFVIKEKSEIDEDEEMEDIATSNKVDDKPFAETLLKKQFIEELEEVMNLHNGDQEISNLANKYISKELDYQRPLDTSFDLWSTLEQTASHLKYKNYPYISELESLLILLESTQEINRDDNEDEIRSLFKQKFGNIAESLAFKCYE